VRIVRALGELIYYGVGVAVLSALVHFVVVLAIPLVATRDAYTSLSELAAPGQTVVLPRASSGVRRFPYLDPAVATAFCRFDLRGGPVRVRAPLGSADLTSISLHSARGAVFYALTDRAATHGAIEAVIVTAAQLRTLVAADDEDNPSQDLRIVSPTLDGYAFRRVFSELPSLYAAAEDEAKTLSCVAEATPK
jgi:uncharacterized membrane protein